MYQYRLKFRGKDEPDVFVPAALVEAQRLQDKFMKSDEVFQWDGSIFRLSDIKRVTKEWVIDYKSEPEQHVELSDEERLNSARRLRWIRTYILVHKKAKSLEDRLQLAKQALPEDEHEGYEKFVRWYHSPEQTERRELRDEFRRTHFDIFFPTHEAFDRAFQKWLEARNQPSLVPIAEEIFGVSAD